MAGTRIRTIVEHADNTDYYKAIKDSFEMTGTEAYKIITAMSIGTSAETIDLSPYATIPKLVLVNTDPTNYVVADYYQQHGTQAPGATGYAFTDSGTDDTITDADTAGTFVTGGLAAAGDYVRVTASTTGGRDGVYLIQSVTDGDTLVLTNADDLSGVAGTDSTSTLSFERKNRLRIVASTHIIVQLPVIAGDLVLQADTAACVVEIWGVAT